MRKCIPVFFTCLVVGFLLVLPDGYSQKPMCGDGILKSHLERNYPEYFQLVNETFEEVKSRAIPPYRSQEVYTIPVVVHIVWKEEEENLHDSIVHNQIEVLNEDFRRLNADADNIRDIFLDRVGDPGIEFELVDIVRVNTEAEFAVSLFGLPDNVKQSSLGGSDAWDTESHLNIWVCKIQPLTIIGIPPGQVLGFAYPPTGLDNWPDDVSAPSPELDGVVVDYRIFGRNNSLTIDPGIGEPISGYGRTTVHEIGHYLGLRHIWGDGGGLFGGDGCEVDDGVEDTPNQESSSEWTCDTSRNTCIDPVEDLPDMIENYMDYSLETCMNSFTNGQIAIMRAVIEGPRNGLIAPTSTVDNHLSSGVRIFPNPSESGVFNYRIQQGAEHPLAYRVYDQLGRLVNSGQGLSEAGHMDLSGLQSGIYFMRIYDRESMQLVGTEKILIGGH